METSDGRKIKLDASGGRGDYTVRVVRGDGSGASDVVGTVRKRQESYSGIRGRGGRGRLGTYTYWDAESADGRRVVGTTWKCTTCGGEVHTEVRSDNDPYLLPQCTRCGRRYRGNDRPKRSGPGLTTATGRYAKTGASTRQHAIELLVRVTGTAEGIV